MESVAGSSQKSPASDPAKYHPPVPKEPPDDLWERIRLNLSWQTEENARVDRQRKALLRQSEYFPSVADRADYYLYYIVEEVQKRDMPMEIALVPVIESTLDPFTPSYSGAAGLWQIMPGTGRHLGLERDSWYDGRQALRDSTSGALDYLQALYEEFDEDWFLALAAYNAGAGNIAKARQYNEKKGLDTDYWSLNLPRQASNYVPKVIALAQIVADPEQFDVDIPTVDNAPSFEVANTGRPLSFPQAAQLADVDVETLRALNPGQLRESISPNQPTELLLPIGTLDRFEANIAQLSPEELVQWKTYRIKAGDSLSYIAEKFDTPVTLLQEANDIRGSNIRAGDTLKIPGSSSSQNSSQMLASGETAAPQGYQVRKGDSLSRIAHRFKVSVSDITSWNALDPKAYLRPGQKLTLYGTGG
jgi:membrane-bound lytic murein transglycosylase D